MYLSCSYDNSAILVSPDGQTDMNEGTHEEKIAVSAPAALYGDSLVRSTSILSDC